MPRHRKKEGDHRRRLAFAESPVENGPGVITPVRADHPAHVNCVSVCSDTSVTWVSPQFRGVTHSHGKRRQARRRHHSGPSTRLRSVNKENTFADSFRKGTRCQFPALRFLGDARETTSSSSRHKHLPNEHSPNSSARRKSCGRGKRTLRDDRRRGRSVDGRDLEEREENRACDGNWQETGLCRSFDVSADSSCDGLLCKDGSFLTETAILAKKAISSKSGNRTPTQLSTSQISNASRSKSGHSKGHHTPRHQAQSEQKEPQDKPSIVSQDNGRTSSPRNTPLSAGTDAGNQRKRTTRKSFNSGILLSPLETRNDSVFIDKNCNSTAVQKTIAMLHYSPSDMDNYVPAAVNLTDDQLFHGVNCSHASANNLQHEKANNIPSETPSRKYTPKQDYFRHTKSDERCTPKSQRRLDDLDSPSGLRRSMRLREKYLEALKYMQPSSPMTDKTRNSAKDLNHNILVADTPESQYGWSLRKRQLRKHCK